MIYKRTNLRKLIVLILCIGMPFHSIFFAITGMEFLKSWRDVLMFLSLVSIFNKRNGKIRNTTEGVIIFAAICICTWYAFLFHSNRVSTGVWLNTLRIYISTFVAYYIGQDFSDDENFIRKISTLYVKTAGIISVWGIFQMFVLGEKFLWDIGFGISSAVLANGFQRNVGVFSSANMMGVYLVFALILLMYGNVDIKSKKLWIFFLAISLLLTLSTSAIVGFLCCVFYQVITKSESKKLLKVHASFLKGIGIVILGVAVAFALDRALLHGKISDMAAIRIEELFTALLNTDSSRVTSASVHMNDLIRSVDIVKNNFWGVGFSESTFILLGRVPRNLLANAVESSIFTIFFDFGVIVGIIYLIPFIYPIIQEVRYGKKKNLIADKFFITLIVLYIFLPLVSSNELRFFAFLFVGFECGNMNREHKTEVN